MLLIGARRDRAAVMRAFVVGDQRKKDYGAEKDQSSEGDDDDRTSASGRRKQR